MRDLGISNQTLRNWIKQLDVDAGKRLTTDEREELRRLRRENPNAFGGARNPEKSRGLLRPGERGAVTDAYRFIATEKTNYPISLMSRVLGVSRQAFHAWERRPPSQRALEGAFLTELIREIHRPPATFTARPHPRRAAARPRDQVSRKRASLREFEMISTHQQRETEKVKP